MKTGKPCLDILGDQWSPNYSLSHLLLQLQLFLSHPEVENYVNAPAADIYIHSPRLYNQMIQDCIIASRKIHGIILVFFIAE
jgi:ubiquitin-conjugating enzyme E2 U